MKLFTDIRDIKDIENTVIAVGNFDGVHKGHQKIIQRSIKDAESSGYKAAVFTFSNHPRNVIANDDVKNILSPEHKINIFRDLGIDYLFSIPFTMQIAAMKPEEYVNELLIKTFRMKEICCGFNYRFGYKAAGDTKLLMELSLKYQFGIHVMEAYQIDGMTVSSTLIRKAISEGDIKKCNELLGRNYSIGGEVVVGNKLGRTIGFPTSNLVIDKTMITPPSGVYITYCEYNGKKYPSITNVGFKPTIGQYDKNVETHIFDFDKILYGKTINVEFIKMIRPERKFENIELLKKQIAQDCITAKAYHRSVI